MNEDQMQSTLTYLKALFQPKLKQEEEKALKLVVKKENEGTTVDHLEKFRVLLYIYLLFCRIL